jgi:histidinol phosphatase-like enzyme
LAEKHAADVSGSMQTTKDHSVPDDVKPGLLVDLDGTCVDATDDWDNETMCHSGQKPREGVVELLKAYKAAGFRIIGVTNRSTDPTGLGHDLDDVLEFNTDTMRMIPSIDDVVFCADADDAGRKPAAAMLQYAEEAFGLDPVVAMVGNSGDDEDAAAAAGITYFDESEFFAGGAGQNVLDTHTEKPMQKKADAANLMPRSEYYYINDAGEVLAAKDANRRLRFPTTGKGKPAPYSSNLSVVPPGGVEEPGYHGYDYAFNIGEGDAPQDFQGEWMPSDTVLKQLYGSMGLGVNKPFQMIDRARARLLHRALRKRKATRPEEPVIQNPEAVPAQEPTDVAV